MKDHITERRIKFKSKLFTILESDIQLTAGKVTWEQIAFNGTDKSVMVAPITKDNKIIMIKKFCPAINSDELVLPGGKVEKNDSLQKTARRELSEETGLYPKSLTSIGALKILPAYLAGTTYGFIGKDLSKRAGIKGDEKEVIKPVEIPFEKALLKIKQGRIRDVRSMAIILYISTFFPNLVNFHPR